ncbi:MAG TPA: C1 family peptidase [Chitinophagaceae bacterium]|nr:C1 family peptidase [Chitinophagaceae bacterium]
MKKISLLLFILIGTVASVVAQVDLKNRIINNQSDNSKAGFQFTTVVNAEATPVENQAASGTCWSYSTNSFLESEMIKAGGPDIHLSPIYSARCAYMEKAENYVRMHGAVSWGDGGEPHDVINMFARYGAIPETEYTGLNYGTKQNDFGEMMAILKGMLDQVIKAPNHGKLTPVWKDAFSKVLDTYLGVVPTTFNYQGKVYTPMTFAKDVVALKPDNYIEFISQTNTPYWKKSMMLVPDNWEFQHDWNIPMDDMTAIIDYALQHGYTVAWGADVSEKYFSWKSGIAYVPETSFREMTPEERADMFDGPKPELDITPQLRQEAFDDYQTTDDHGMQITGIAKDQTGKQWYIVKNSWGTNNIYKGYLYVSKDYVKYKTTSFMVNKSAIPEDIKQKIGI